MFGVDGLGGLGVCVMFFLGYFFCRVGGLYGSRWVFIWFFFGVCFCLSGEVVVVVVRVKRVWG